MEKNNRKIYTHTFNPNVYEQAQKIVLGKNQTMSRWIEQKMINMLKIENKKKEGK